MRVPRALPVLLLCSVLVAALAAPGGAAAIQEGPADARGFLTGPNDGDPDDIAIAYVRAALDGLGSADVRELEVASSYRSRHSGVTHVNLSQHHRGREVFGAVATVSIAPDGSVVHVGETLVRGLDASGAAEVRAAEAVEAAAAALGLDEPVGLRVLRRQPGPKSRTVLSSGGISHEPIPARLGWQPTDDGLRLAWQLVIDDAADAHLWNATVDAETGELLQVDDWTSESSYEAVASLLARSPESSTGAVGSSTAITTPDPVEDGSSYRVFAFPKESPNDGERTLVTNPADALASPFGWHDVNGTPEPDHTTARGNNAHAYTDHPNDDVADPGDEVDGGTGLAFDFGLDLSLQPHDYADAAVTNLFYWCNVAHDLFYRYGFDEPSGNFQVNNYGRGGVGGDDVRCQAQDGGGTNNANFSTPAADGGRPRMQMYLWDVGLDGLPNVITVDPPSSAAGTYEATSANFGPAFDETGVNGAFAVVNDGTANPSEGCDPLIDFPAGAIAIADRGSCTFVQKVLNAQDAGAVAVIIVNNTASAPITLGGSSAAVAIPSGMVWQADGATIKAGLPASGSVTSNPDRDPLRDGDLEAGIILHEYSHGVSNRLTGGPGVNCLSGQERMGEGWSDYHAIAGLIDPALDDPEGPRGMGTYALWQDEPPRQGAGIRPRPYSRNMGIQPFTYDRIRSGAWITGGSLAVPHGVGHGWAVVLWDLTWDLIDRHGFNPNLYEAWDTGGNNRAYQYVMDGLKLQGCAPGFVDGRDAIIAAANALGGEDTCLLWSAFARRGLGASAAQGTSADRNDNTEAFDVPSACRAPGEGFVGQQATNAPAMTTRAAGSTIPLQFSLDGDRGLDVLKAAHSPASQQIDCATLAPVQFALTEPTQMAGGTSLTYNPQQDRYQYNWQTEEGWADTCRQLILTLADGTQHRANFRFVEPT